MIRSVLSPLRAVVLAAVLVGGVGVSGLAAPVAPDEEAGEAFSTVAEYRPDAQECAFLNQINAHRPANRPLKLSRRLGAAADHHSQDMARRNYFDHISPEGQDPFERMAAHGYRFNTAKAENIAAGNAGARATFLQWRGSAGHNQNMLNAAYKAIGIGRAFNANAEYGWYWTTTFGGVVDATVLC